MADDDDGACPQCNCCIFGTREGSRSRTRPDGSDAERSMASSRRQRLRSSCTLSLSLFLSLLKNRRTSSGRRASQARERDAVRLLLAQQLRHSRWRPLPNARKINSAVSRAQQRGIVTTWGMGGEGDSCRDGIFVVFKTWRESCLREAAGEEKSAASPLPPAIWRVSFSQAARAAA